MRWFTDSPWAAVVVGLAMLVGLYAGAYLLTVDAVPVSFLIGDLNSIDPASPPTDGTEIRVPHPAIYRGNQDLLSLLFTPVHAIDRQIRSDYWSYTLLLPADSRPTAGK